MGLIHHKVVGTGRPPIVFVHGFACAHADWDDQVAYFSPRHQTVAVDLRGHGASPGVPAVCSMERFGADVADVLRALDLPPAILVGHSMGCRVVLEAALQVPAQTAGVILVDGSQFAPAMAPVLREAFATADGYAKLTGGFFKDMFTAKTDPAIASAVAARAAALPSSLGARLLTDLLRYDVTRLTASLAGLRVPVLALQSTFSDEYRARRPMQPAQTTPYLDMLRAHVPDLRCAVVPDTGHFPQIDEPALTNALIEDFIASRTRR